MIERLPQLPTKPQRIVSLVPSQTELLYDLGLRDEVVGITKFCIHPNEWFRSKTRVGGTKNVHLNRIHQLQPDLILANKEENVKEQVNALQDIYPVYVSDIHTVDDALQMIEDIGQLVHCSQSASTIIEKIQTQRLQYPPQHQVKRVLYLIWKDPYMCAGTDTFIHSMMREAGFENIIHQTRYPEIDINTIRDVQPDVIFLSSEPYPFQQKHIDQLQKELPHTRAILVDGEIFSWYGSRMIQSFMYFRALHEQLAE
jgi:ABC-type Fe3+-hydroxamate transport system substrate-binding protein